MAESLPSNASYIPEKPVRNGQWNSLNHWVSCVCVVTFDLELGQAIEVSEVNARRRPRHWGSIHG